MKLFTELNENIEVLVEENEGKRDHYIKGVFLQAEMVNKNGRFYPKEILAKEVKRYTDEYITKKRAFGELGHPDGPSINLERVSHMVTEMYEDGKNFIGKAKIMDTPYGNIVKNLIDEGALLGVSSRGMGSLKETGGKKVVQNDFYLATAADIVADPSAPEAFVQGIMENKEWVFQNGVLVEKDVEEIKQEIERASINRTKLQEAKLKAFQRFLTSL